jgi:phenylpropionate dioxygenase-like ring-hydroxylating dioxygenase large terminal subunit
VYDSATKELQSRPAGLSLAKRFYTEDSVYQRDVQWLRENMWWIVGHESQIPNSGDYFLHGFDQDSVIVIRDNEGRIRAHHNVCRHRGSRLCTKAAGNVPMLTCPYHAWSYGLDGKLRAASVTAVGFDKSLYTLIPCHVRVNCGLIFLSFAEVPPDFGVYISFLTRELELQDVQHSKVAKRTLLSASANWKLLVQNNLECYHCRPAHPTYCAAHPGVPLVVGPEDNLYDRVRTLVRDSESERNRHVTPVYTGHECSAFQQLCRLPIGEGCATESVGGRPVAPLMGQSEYEGVQTFAQPSPLTSVYLNPDNVVIYTFTPRSRRRTDIDVMWLVKETAVEGVDFETSKVTDVWEPTLQEDKTLAENTQLGIESTAYRPGPYMEAERRVGDFDLWYLTRMASESVPT